MRKSILLTFLFICSSLLIQAQFTAGNITALRAESASGNNTTLSIIEVNNSTPAQALPANVVAINGTTGTTALRTSGSAGTTGYLANSNDGTLVCFSAHNSTTTTGNANAIVPRGVGILNASGFFSLATIYSGASGQQTRGANTINNTDWFIGDQSGVYTNNTTSPSPAGNMRSVKTFGGTSYIFQASTSFAPVGIISAPSGGTITPLPGVANGASANQDFYLISSANNGTFDILYILSATSATAGSIVKYSLVSGTWVSNGSYTTNFGGFGLAAAANSGSAFLYVTSGNGTTASNNIIKLTDANGYNLPVNITTGNNVILYTTVAGTTLKGIAFSPIVPAVPTVNANQYNVNFGNVLTAAFSAAQTISLSAFNLSAAAGTLTVRASNNNFQIFDGITWGSSATVNYSNSGTTIDNFQIRFSPQSSGAKTGNVTITGGGLAAAVNIAVTGTGDNSLSLTFSSATTPALNPPAVSGTINDLSDPAFVSGIITGVKENSIIIPAADYTLTASSANTTVVPNANIAITKADGAATIKINPAAAGYSTITLTLTKGTDTKMLVINYAASQPGSATSNWLTGIADASSAIAIDDNYMIVANDETNYLYVYNRNQPGLYVKRYDFNQANVLSLTDGSTGNWKETDAEAGVKSIAVPGRIYWMGSLSNSSNAPFEDKPNRDRLFAITANGTGAATTFADDGHYNNLRQQLILWGDANGYNFTASAANFKDPKVIDGFNAEGMVFGPDNTTLYVGFRAPLVPMGSRTKAVIAPIENFESWFNNGSPAGNPTIGSPIELDLGGRGIREMIRLSNGNYIIVAGSYGLASVPAIYSWSGNPVNAPVAQPSFDLTGLNAEAVMGVNQGGVLSLNKLQVISDNGDVIYYGDVAAKDLAQDNWRKFGADIITSAAGGVLPVMIEYFTAVKNSNSVLLSWKTASADNSSLFEILRSVNGRDFNVVGTVPVISNQLNYTFNDINVPGVKLYYRISTKNNNGERSLSAIRFINTDPDADVVKIYPNPVVNNFFTVTFTKAGRRQVSIFNSAGTLQDHYEFTETAKDINTASWPKGHYRLRITSADGSISQQQIVVQ